MGVDKSIYLGPYFEVKEGVDTWTAIEACGERLYRASSMGDQLVKGKEIFLANVNLEGFERETRLNDMDGAIELFGLDPLGEKGLFARQFKAEMEVLKRLYGDVIVRWGIVVTWN